MVTSWMTKVAFLTNFKVHVDYFILGKFHWNIYIFKDFKGVGQIGSKCTMVQIGLTCCTGFSHIDIASVPKIAHR